MINNQNHAGALIHWSTKLVFYSMALKIWVGEDTLVMLICKLKFMESLINNSVNLCNFRSENVTTWYVFNTFGSIETEMKTIFMHN